MGRNVIGRPKETKIRKTYRFPDEVANYIMDTSQQLGVTEAGFVSMLVLQNKQSVKAMKILSEYDREMIERMIEAGKGFDQ